MAKTKSRTGITRRQPKLDKAQALLDETHPKIAQALDLVKAAQDRARQLDAAGREATSRDAGRRAPSLDGRRNL